MSEGKRPGGLTALAVLNFVFSAFGGLQTLGHALIVVIVVTDKLPPGADEEMQRAFEMFRELGIGTLATVAALGVVTVGLQITSGVGYLLQKRVLGRWLGNLYALTSIGHSVFMTMQLRAEGAAESAGGFELITLVLIIYPVLTLILINTTFREDLTR